MRKHLNRKDYLTGPDVHILVSRISEALLMTIRRALLNENEQFVESLLGIGTITHMACRCLSFTLTSAFWALSLELLDKARCKSLRLHHDSLAIASWACLNVLWIVCSSTSTVRTQSVSSVLDLHFLSIVDILQRNLDLNLHTRARLFLLPTAASAKASTKEISEEVTEGVPATMTFWLAQAFLTSLVVFPAPIWITQRVISCSYVLVLLKCILVTLIFIWVVLPTQLFECLLDISLFGTARNAQYFVEVSLGCEDDQVLTPLKHLGRDQQDKKCT